MITDSIHVSVFLVSVIHIGAVVAFIQNVWKINRKTLSTLDTIVGLFFFVGPFFFYHLRRCLLHRRPLLRCGQCLSEQGCVHRGSCRICRQLHPCQSQTGGDCKGGRSCPGVKTSISTRIDE